MAPSALFGAQHRRRGEGIEESRDIEFEGEWENHGSVKPKRKE
jgi:hypothetical protein